MRSLTHFYTTCVVRVVYLGRFHMYYTCAKPEIVKIKSELETLLESRGRD